VYPARREGAARSSTGRSRSALAHAVRVDPTVHPVATPRPKHLRVAPKVSRRVLRQRRRARWAVVGVAAISAASMFLLVTFHVFAVQSSFQLDKLEHQRSDALRKNELLRNLVASRSSATTIFEAATARGFVRPANVIQLNVSRTGPGTPTPSPTPVRMPWPDYNSIAAGP
jgi:hypothetical protein